MYRTDTVYQTKNCLKQEKASKSKSLFSSRTDIQRISNTQIMQKYPGETAPNASTITRLVQWFHDTGSVADRKQSGRATIVKTKVADVETALQRIPLKIQSVYIDITAEFISSLNSDERCLGCSETVQRVTHYGKVWKF
ncbi:DUF4817 domain-containing protein [Trichonephila clavipes]|nr:DUF4817 domain-containing protein [Trichonephila clavipes]